MQALRQLSFNCCFGKHSDDPAVRRRLVAYAASIRQLLLKCTTEELLVGQGGRRESRFA